MSKAMNYCIMENVAKEMYRNGELSLFNFELFSILERTRQEALFEAVETMQKAFEEYKMKNKLKNN